MAVNDPTYADGSLILISSTGGTITVYYADGSFYTVHEYGVLSISVMGIAGANVGKINGVSVANIAKVNGVAA